MTLPDPSSPPVAPLEDFPVVPMRVTGKMGRAAGSGAAWMMSATVFTKILTFVAQIVLGSLLTRDDFGLFAMAVATTKFVTICQDGGVRDLLVQRGLGDYEKFSGRVFWFAMCFNLVVATLVAAVAWPVANLWFKDDRLVNLLLVLALSVPLGTPGAVLNSKLRLDFNFAATSWVMILSGVVRQVGTVSLALAACGSMSFVVPAVLAAIVESAASWWFSRDTPWKRAPEFGTWIDLFKQAKWLIFGSVANLLIDRGPYLVMQPFLVLGGVNVALATGVLGEYFWAFEVTAQLGVLLSYNMQLVLMPVLSRFKDDIPRLRDATIRSMSGLMMMGSFSSLAMAVMMDPLEGLIFNGKWANATPAVAVFGLFFPFRILYGLTTAVQLAMNQSRTWCLLSFAEGIAFTLAGAVVAIVAAKGWMGTLVGVDAASLAWATGGTLAIVRIFATLWVMRQIGARRRAVLVEMIWPWLLAVLSAAIAHSLDAWLNLEGLVTRRWDVEKAVCEITIGNSDGFAGWFVAIVQGWGLNARADAAIIEGTRLVLLGLTITIAFGVLARVLMPDMLREACRVAPGPFGRLGRRFLRLARDKG
ncbi:MAG: oligosaccharide flippase family protein [Planctomycetota bacterium]